MKLRITIELNVQPVNADGTPEPRTPDDAEVKEIGLAVAMAVESPGGGVRPEWARDNDLYVTVPNCDFVSAEVVP